MKIPIKELLGNSNENSWENFKKKKTGEPLEITLGRISIGTPAEIQNKLWEEFQEENLYEPQKKLLKE